MKFLSWISVATFLSTIVVAICLLVSLSKLREGATTREPGRDGTAAVALCHRGLILLAQDESGSANSDSTEKGGAMVQNAWALQSQYPSAVPGIWLRTEKWSATLPVNRRYLTLVLYLQSINDAIDLCEEADTFDLLWQVRIQVSLRIEKVEQHRTNALSNELEKLIEEIDSKGVEQYLRSNNLSKEFKDLRSRIEGIDEASEELPKVIGDRLESVNNVLSSWFDKQVATIKEQYATEKQRDTESIAPVNAGEQDERNKGGYTKLLHHVDRIWTMRISPATQFWMQFAADTAADSDADLLTKDAKVNAGSLDQRLRKLRSEITYSVRIRYNMWAVTQIYQAGLIKGPRGCVALGRIDNGLLEPAVRALYSPAERDVLDSIVDPAQRQNQVRKMLLSTPVGLVAF